MSMYRTVTANGKLLNNTIQGSADVSPNKIQASGKLVTDLKHNTVSDYELLTNKPQINNVTLNGNKSFEQLGLEGISNMDLENILT